MGQEKLSEEIIEAIYLLLDSGFNQVKTARVLNISLRSVNNYKRIRDLGIDSTGKLRDFQAKEKGYENNYYYQLHLAKQRGHRRVKRPLTEYQNEKSKEQGYRNATHRTLERRKQIPLEKIVI